MFHKLWMRFCGLNANMNATVNGGNGGAGCFALPYVPIISCDVDNIDFPPCPATRARFDSWALPYTFLTSLPPIEKWHPLAPALTFAHLHQPPSWTLRSTHMWCVLLESLALSWGQHLISSSRVEAQCQSHSTMLQHSSTIPTHTSTPCYRT
jgi:hypothetical protein